MNLPDGWILGRLGDVLTRVETKVDPQASSADSHFYVGLEDIESHTGRLLRKADEITDASDILSIKTAFNAGDILYGKLRPNLNKVLLADKDGICSTDIWALTPSEGLSPEFAVRYLRSPAVYVRAAQLAAGANLPRLSAAAFDRLPIPLPTLVEQERIVDVLRQAEAATLDHRSRHLELDAMIKSALDELVLASNEDEWEQLGRLAETRYGTSLPADATAESGTAVLRIPNVMRGEVDTEDLKYVDLPQDDLKRLSLTVADVLIVRSNGNPDYVGRSAPITEDVVQSPMVYASYLIRLRTNNSRLLPEYLSAFLNSAYGRAALRNVIRTTAGQSNLSGESLAKVRLPIPSLSKQEWFRDCWLQVRQLRRLIVKSERAAKELLAELSIRAFSGDLTTVWRLEHAVEISEAPSAQEVRFRAHKAMVSVGDGAKGVSTVDSNLTVRASRHWLLGELGEFQRQVLAAITAYWQVTGQPLLVDDPEMFASFCEDAVVMEHLRDVGLPNGNRIRRSLSQLAAVGLIAKVALPKQAPENGKLEYLKAFRPLRIEEYTRLADVQALRKALSHTVDRETP